MKCPQCGARETKVVDKRDNEEATVTRRRRECLTCAHRFTTYERPELAALIVAKKDGRREEFSREKLRRGLQKACVKRPISADQIERMVNEIERELRRRDSLEHSSQAIGDLVMEKLKAVDKVAYIRFASVYRAYGDPASFEEEIRRLQQA